MRILLVQDISGVHEYLYRGLIALGHQCELVTFGKTTIAPIANSRIFFPLKGWGWVGKLLRPLLNLFSVLVLPKYDVVSYAHRISFIDKPLFLRYLDIPLVARKARVMSYIGLGCDELSYIHLNTDLPYTPCHSCERQDFAGWYCLKVNRPIHRRALDFLNKHFSVVVTTSIEYDHIQKAFNGQSYRIPYPLDLSEVPWIPANHLREKLIIIHTPSRKGFKGTDIVLDAIELLKIRRADFEFCVLSDLTFHEYIEQVKVADVVIDQIWSQSSGMNALWLLAMGKIVFSGNTDLCKNYFSFGNQNPTIDAPPDANQLADKLEILLADRKKIPEIVARGRDYISLHHDHILVAQRYVDIWRDLVEGNGKSSIPLKFVD